MANKRIVPILYEDGSIDGSGVGGVGGRGTLVVDMCMCAYTRTGPRDVLADSGRVVVDCT